MHSDSCSIHTCYIHVQCSGLLWDRVLYITWSMLPLTWLSRNLLQQQQQCHHYVTTFCNCNSNLLNLIHVYNVKCLCLKWDRVQYIHIINVMAKQQPVATATARLSLSSNLLQHQQQPVAHTHTRTHTHTHTYTHTLSSPQHNVANSCQLQRT